jgi:uncharacterized protein HemX
MPNNNQNPNVPHVEANVRVNTVPMMLTMLLSTVAAVGATIFLVRKFDDKKRKEIEEAEARRREDDAIMNPQIPMMWPGLQPPKQAEKEPNSQLTNLTARLDNWQNQLAKREKQIMQQQNHLKLVMGGEEFEDEEYEEYEEDE